MEKTKKKFIHPILDRSKDILKEKLEFHDKNGNLAELKIEIKAGKLSISGKIGGGCGQCQDSIKPANTEQFRLLEIWDKWHLNDMHAGTEKQEEAVKAWLKKGNKYDYTKVCHHLRGKQLQTDNGYKYGSAWLKRELPSTLYAELTNLCDTIRAQEQKRRKDLGEGEYDEDTPNQIKALAKYLKISPNEAQEDISEGYDENHLEYSGASYIVAEDHVCEDLCRESLEKYLWVEAVKNDDTTDSFEEWQDEVIKSDGYGSILNSWDGSEHTEEVDGTTYYIFEN